MKIRLVLPFALLGVTAAMAAPGDTLGLLGLSANDLTTKLGQAEEITGEPDAGQFYNFKDGLSVHLYKDVVTVYIAAGNSEYKTDKGIKLGATLDEVTTVYGGSKGTDHVSAWENTSKEQVLYHNTAIDEYKINYQSANVSFLFDREQKLRSIWVSNTFAKEE